MNLHHANRNDLVGEHKLTDIGQIILLIIFLTVWSLDSFIFKLSTFLSLYIPLSLRFIISLTLIIFSGIFGLSSHKIIFGEVKEKPVLIEKGIYNYVRHPMYFASLLFISALVISTLSVVSFVILTIIFIFYDYVSGYEEKLLENKFGEEYIRYKKRVSKWFPLKWQRKF